MRRVDGWFRVKLFMVLPLLPLLRMGSPGVIVILLSVLLIVWILTQLSGRGGTRG